MNEARAHKLFWIATGAFALLGVMLNAAGASPWWSAILFALLPALALGIFACLFFMLWLAHGDKW